MQLLTRQDLSTALPALWEMVTGTIQGDPLTFFPAPPANRARSSREGKSISGVVMEFEAGTEFHAIKEPPVCSDSTECLLTVHQHWESWADHMLT